MTREEATEIYESKVWKSWSDEKIASFQLNEERLCMPFAVFQGALERVLGRGIQTIEFGMNADGLRRELERKMLVIS